MIPCPLPALSGGSSPRRALGGCSRPILHPGGLIPSWALPPCSGRVWLPPLPPFPGEKLKQVLCKRPGQGHCAAGHPAKVRGWERWIPALDERGGDHLARLLFAQRSKLIAWRCHGPSVRAAICAELCARRPPPAKPLCAANPLPVAAPGSWAERSPRQRRAPRLPHTQRCWCRSRPPSPPCEAHLWGFGVGPGWVRSAARSRTPHQRPRGALSLSRAS